MEKIDGEALLGFSDFFSTDSVGYDSVGAEKPEAKRDPQPPVRRPSPPKANKQGIFHGTVLQRGKNVLAKTVKSTMQAKSAASRAPAKLSPVASRAVMTMARSKVGYDEFGAAVKPKQSAAQQAKAKSTAEKAKKALDKLKKIQETQKKARVVTAKVALNARGKAKDLAKGLVNQKKMSKLLRTPLRKRTKSMIGFLEDMAHDPAYASDAINSLIGMASCIGQDEFAMPEELPPEEMLPADADLEATLNALDSDTNKLDAPISTTPAKAMDLNLFFTAQKREDLGGIVYDESKGRPNGFALSYGLATRTTDRPITISTYGAGGIDGVEHNGYVWGSYEQERPEKGIRYGEVLPSGTWNHLHGRRHGHNWGPEYDRVDESVVVGQNNPKNNTRDPEGRLYGPIIGNPDLPDFKNLRMDDTGVFFWIPDEAPEWVTSMLKKVADATAAKLKASEDAAAKAEQAARAKAQADMEAEKARVDAENAIAEAKAASEAKILEQQQEGEASAALIQQQQVETAAKSVETTQAQQAGDILMQQAQMQQQMMQQQAAFEQQRMQQQMELMKQYPELAYEEGYGGGGSVYDEAYGDEGANYGEDYGENMPGGDDTSVMSYNPYAGMPDMEGGGEGEEEGGY